MSSNTGLATDGSVDLNTSNTVVASRQSVGDTTDCGGTQTEATVDINHEDIHIQCDVAHETGNNRHVTGVELAANCVQDLDADTPTVDSESTAATTSDSTSRKDECPIDSNLSVPTNAAASCDSAENQVVEYSPEVAEAAKPRSEDNSLSSDWSADTDESEQFGGYTVNRVHSDSDGAELLPESSNTEVAAESSQDSNHAGRNHEDRVRRKRQHNLLSHSSSSNSSSSSESDFEMESDIEAKTSRLDVSEEAVIQLPQDCWRPLKELFDRQLGRFRCPKRFVWHAGSSVSLASRLTLYNKHELHDGCVNALNFNESGTLIASGSDDLKVVIFDWIRAKTYIAFDTGHRANVFQAKFLPHTGDCHIVTCARDGQVRLAQLSTTGTCKATKRLVSHKMAAHKLALIPDSPHVFYSCGEDSVVYQVDLRREQPQKCYMTKENDRRIALYSIHVNPFNSYEHCVGGRDQYIRIYDVRKISDSDNASALVKKFCPHHLLTGDYKAHVTCAVYNHNGTELIGTYNDDDIYLFDNGDSDGAAHRHKYTGHRNNATVKGVNFYGPRSEFIVSGSDCGNVFIWHRDTEKIVNFFHADDGGVVNVLEPHPHLPILATSGLDNDVKLWMPAATEPSAALSSLSRVTKKNAKDREDERNEPEVIDSQMLWFLMHTLRRNATRHGESGRGRMFFGMTSSDQSDDDSAPNADDDGGGADDDDDDDDDDDGPDVRARCTTS